jgi:hypothetical protein
MADYYSPTVIQPPIPVAAMTPLERLLLENIFSASDSADGGGLYFYAEEGPVDFIVLSRVEIDEALVASNGTAGTAATFIAERLTRVAPEEAEIDLDLSGASIWESIFQEIVRRSPTLRYVAAITSFECSKMRPDGFGGMAVLITADRILSKSTHDLIAEFLAETGLDA